MIINFCSKIYTKFKVALPYFLMFLILGITLRFYFFALHQLDNGLNIKINDVLVSNPFGLLTFIVIFFIFISALKLFFYRNNHKNALTILSIINTLLSLLCSFNISRLQSKIQALNANFLDEISVDHWGKVKLVLNRTPEETWTSICRYINLSKQYYKLTTDDLTDLCNYIRNTKPSMAETICYLNSLYAKRIEILEKAVTELAKVEIVPVQVKVEKSIGFFDIIQPFFTSDYYHLGTISFVFVSFLFIATPSYYIEAIYKLIEESNIVHKKLSTIDELVKKNDKAINQGINSVADLQTKLAKVIDDVDKLMKKK